MSVERRVDPLVELVFPCDLAEQEHALAPVAGDEVMVKAQPDEQIVPSELGAGSAASIAACVIGPCAPSSWRAAEPG